MNAGLDITHEFVVEAREHTDKIEKILLMIEKGPKDVDGGPIGDIQRSLHSIKGAAGFLGYDNIKELSHVLETLLQILRSGEIDPGPDVIDTLLSGVDGINHLLDHIRESNGVDIRHILDRLAGLIDSPSASSRVRSEIETVVSFADTLGRDIDIQVSEFSLNTLPPEYDNFYLLKYDLIELQNQKGKGPASLVKTLLEKGIILEANLQSAADDLNSDLAFEPLMYQVLYATGLDTDAVAGAIGLAGDRVVEVRRKEPVFEPSLAEETGPEYCDFAAGPTAGGPRDTVRVSVDLLDRLMTLAGELVLVRNRNMLSADLSNPVSRGISQHLDIVTSDIQETVMLTRMQPVGKLLSKLPRLVRELSKKLDKQIDIAISGGEAELDRGILETLGDPLIHMIRNCCDHGIESQDVRRIAGKPDTGRIAVDAWHEAGQVNIRITDDGRGIDPSVVRDMAIRKGIKTKAEISRMNDREAISLIWSGGFSTATTVSDISGRGVGLDVVKTVIEKSGGSLEIESEFGRGTTVHIRLPLTLAIIPCLIVIVGDRRYAIPQINIVELVCLYDDDVCAKIERAGNREVYRLRDRLLPMARMNEVLARPEPFTEEVITGIAEKYGRQGQTDETPESLSFAVVKSGARCFGLIVDRIIGTEEIVVKPMHPAVKNLGIYSGVTVMGDGKVSLILDIEGVARHSGVLSWTRPESDQKADPKKRDGETQPVLLFKSGESERFALSLPLVRRIRQIDMSGVERVGDREFVTIDGASTFVLRIDKLLRVSSCVEKEEMLLILPKYAQRPFGILVSKIIDVAETPVELDTESYVEDGLLGSAIVWGHMTLFVDIFRLIELADPDWFAARRKATPPPKNRKNVLVVEDTALFRNLIKSYLEADNYSVTTAENGREALELIREKKFDMVLSDLDMPVMDGWTFLKRVRAGNDNPTIPAIAITALNSEEDRKKAGDAGFDAYEVKLDREKLLTNVAEMLKQR